MRSLIIILVVVGVVAFFAFRAVAASRRSRDVDTGGTEAGGRIEADASDYPEPGEGSPQGPQGGPMPGSEADRRRHGKP